MKLAVALLTLAVAMPVMADNDVLEERSAEKKDSLGLTFEPNERLLINAWLRGQFRYSDPFDSDPKSLQDYAEVPGEDFEVRRGRIKVKGHLFNPKIGFYYEHELTGDHPLLDLRLDIHLREDIELRVGQHKVLYNRERVDSSGKQQFVERSISTYAFTVDRQVGATFLKKFMPDTKMNNLLFLGVNKGNGRGGIDRRNGDPMYLARWQWHFLGEELPFSQSDLKFREVPAASLSFAAAQVRGHSHDSQVRAVGNLTGSKMAAISATRCSSFCRSLRGTTMACLSSRNFTSRRSKTMKRERIPHWKAAMHSSANSGKKSGSAETCRLKLRYG
jgi:hypothetical protein